MSLRKKVKYSKRAGSALLNFLICLCLSVIIDFAFMHNVMQNAYNYPLLQESYDKHLKDYQKKQDDYGLYIYNAKKERIPNPDVTKEQKENFAKDPIVISLATDMKKADSLMNECNLLTFVFDGLAGTFIGFIFGDILFGVGRSFGALMNHFKVEETDEKKKAKWYKMILYGFTKWIFYIPLGVGSALIIPIVINYKTYYSEQQTSPIDKWFHFELVVPEKYASDE